MIKLNENGTVEMPLEIYEALFAKVDGKVFLPENIGTALDIEGMTQTELADRMKVSKGALNKVIRHQVKPTAVMLTKLKAVFPDEPYIFTLPRFSESYTVQEISWEKIIPHILTLDPKQRAEVDLLLQGRSLNALSSNRFSVKPERLLRLCQILGLDVHDVLNVPVAKSNPVGFGSIREICLKQGISLLAMVAKKRGLTHSGLAEALGCHLGQVRNWIYGDAVPNLTSHLKLCRYFDTRFDFWDFRVK